MRASRGMGIINPDKMPRGKKIIRKDNPNVVTEYKKGGKVNFPTAIKPPKGVKK
jgi:hypothetical protein